MKDFLQSKLANRAQGKIMGKAIEYFDDIVHDDDKLAQAAGTTAGIGAPAAVVTATGAATGLAGGAAIMKTLALAGTVVGGGAMAGLVVVGTGAVAVGWGVKQGVKKVRSRKKNHQELSIEESDSQDSENVNLTE